MAKVNPRDCVRITGNPDVRTVGMSRVAGQF